MSKTNGSGEPYAYNDWEVEEYNAMCASVEKYDGFYIARFEAGDGDATEERIATTDAHTVVSKKGAIIYNYVHLMDDEDEIGTTSALYLSQNMYKDSTSVVSTLCYGIQWDATMNFVSDATHDITNSVSWGNYGNSTGDAAENCGSIQKSGTNEAWKSKQIYDLAGNAKEWTMEPYTGLARYARGGSAYDLSYYGWQTSSASKRETRVIYGGYGEYSFRVTLYLK